MMPTHFALKYAPSSRARFLLLYGALGLSGLAVAQAETPVASAEGGYTLTLKQLGRQGPMNLQGVDSADSVSFDIRADNVVTAAELLVRFSYSPALLADLSQINVLVNGEVAGSIPLVKEGAGIPQEHRVKIAPQMITEFNRLSLQFVGHYTLQCEDPQHSSLWAKISDSSELTVQVSPIQLKNDLSALPLPLFDRRDSRALNLPFVFPGTPDMETLEAAGALSSWLGGLASYRSASFPVSIGQVPAKGSAVLLINAKTAQAISGVTLPAISGATVSLINNPNDPYGKLLIIAGRDGAELKRAAAAVALGSKALTGDTVTISQLDALAPRQPYDAPNWVASNRLVRLGELIEDKKLNVAGYNAGSIPVPLHLPPALFNGNEKSIPLNLKYSYTPQQESSNSSLLVSLNDRFIKSMPLPSSKSLGDGQPLLELLKEDQSLPRKATVLLPLSTVTATSELQFRFMYDYIKQGECRDIIVDNMRGSIDPDSTLDLRGYDHYIAMPNLRVFNESGFPFTRLADLSQTAVVMPASPSLDEQSLYLNVLGRFGNATGLAATGIQVINATQVQDVADKDLLIIASGGNQPLLKQWASSLPASGENREQRFDLADLALRVRNWVSPDPQANQRKPKATVRYSGESSTYLAGFESPLKRDRTVVVIAGGSPQGLADISAAMIGGDEYEDSIQGSLTVVQGKQVTSLVAEQSYYVGELGPFKRVQWWLSQHLGGLLLVTALGVALLTGLIYLGLRAQARRRLA